MAKRKVEKPKHDSLCPWRPADYWFEQRVEPKDCQCELIALVRQEERESSWDSFDDTQRWDEYMKGTMME